MSCFVLFIYLFFRLRTFSSSTLLLPLCFLTKVAKVAQDAKGSFAQAAGLPFIAIIFWYKVGSGRMLLLPLISTIFAYLTASGIGLALTLHGLQTPTFQPQVWYWYGIVSRISTIAMAYCSTVCGVNIPMNE